MCKLDCKSFFSALDLKNCKCCLRRWQEKEKDFDTAVGKQDKVWIQTDNLL